jgi:hypothetical protein
MWDWLRRVHIPAPSLPDNPFTKANREWEKTSDMLTILTAGVVLQGWSKAVEDGDDARAQRVLTEIQTLVDATHGRLEMIVRSDRVEVRFAGGAA